MPTFTRRVPEPPATTAAHTLRLTADERTRSRYRFVTDEQHEVALSLPRGTVLRDGDVLTDDTGVHFVRVLAKPEPVLTVRAPDPYALLRATYHLGNRHVPVELGRDYLRLSPDPVLAEMLRQLLLTVIEEVAPFRPEGGAYAAPHHGAHARLAPP